MRASPALTTSLKLDAKLIFVYDAKWLIMSSIPEEIVLFLTQRLWVVC